jgi:WD40 repeat protein
MNWTTTATLEEGWASAASSADGAKFVAVNNAGLVVVSTNSGTTWATNLAPIAVVGPVAMSVNGSEIIAGAAADGPIYLWQSA